MANIRALQALQAIPDDGSQAPTNEQMDALRGWSGWGGCADAFSAKPEWADINDRLKDLLEPEEYAQARASTLTAFYTPGAVVKAMWDSLKLGSAPIQVLEPGCGIGNFMAGVPDDANARMTGIEIDPTSARIAALLNPDASILNADLHDCIIDRDSFDLAIGNVPYSADISFDYRLLDGRTTRLPLHDYCIACAVDALAPDGMAMLLTSRFTLDKRTEALRADLARKAELVGVVRLPSSTFTGQAGTRAVTDVIVLRKRAKALDMTPDEPWVHSTTMPVPGYDGTTVNVNQAIAGDMENHAVGDIRPVIGRFGGDFDVTFDGGIDQIGRRLTDLLETQIGDAGLTRSTGKAKPLGQAEVLVRPDHVSAYEYTVDARGVIWYGDDNTVVEAGHGDGEDARRLRGMIRLRDLARDLQRLELDPALLDEATVEAKRRELNQAYDEFTAEFGHLCDRKNRRAYSPEEAGRHLVMALEETDEQGRWKGKARCFTQRTINPVTEAPNHADNLDDAMSISLNQTGKVDLGLIAKLTDTTEEEAEAGLGDRIVRDPDTGEVVPAEDWLSGDIAAKLAHVTSLADGIRRRADHEAGQSWLAESHTDAADGIGAADEAEEWRRAAGKDMWRSLVDPYGAPSYRDQHAAIGRVGETTWSVSWGRRPDIALALAARAIDEMPEGQRLTTRLPREPRKHPGETPEWHDAHGASALWDALCWTTGDDPGASGYAPLIASRNMPVRALAAFVHKIAHTDKLATEDKAAILENLFDSYSARDPETAERIWTDTSVGRMCRQLMPDLSDPKDMAVRLATDPAASEWIWARARDLDPRQTQASRLSPWTEPPVSVDAAADRYPAFRERRAAAIAAWREQPEHAASIRQDAADLQRLERLESRLRRAQPTRLDTDQIKAPLGAPWIPAKDIHEFMMETFGINRNALTNATLAKFRVDWIRDLGQWRVGYSGSDDIGYKAMKEFGTEDRNPFQLLEACLNNAQITVTKESPTEFTASGNPKRVKDQKATMAAIEKADRIRDAWNRWVFEDPARAERLTAEYNRRFNNIRPRQVDGSYLTTPGIAAGVQLRPHQKNAVARALRSDEGTLIAHVVGAGKTFEGIVLTHEAKRLGKASKPMLVVPNHLVDQWAGDVLKLYPASRVLVMDKDAQRSPESVRRFWGRVMTGDWDAVIVPQSRFSQLHVSRKRRVENMRERVDEFTEAVAEAARTHGKKDPTVKRLEAARKSAEAAMQRLRDGKESRDDKALAGIEFEQLGVDMLVVDEAHQYKNLGVPVASADLGMQLSSAAKCEDLLDKCEWLREAGHGGNIAFMTGTPVSNSMSELYNMQRYLAPKTLESQELDTFAAWAAAYGQVVPSVELKPEGNGFQIRQRFARFQNLPELMNAVKQFTDMVTNDDIQLPLPELESVPVAVPATEEQKEEMLELSARADEVRDGKVDPDKDNLLKITSDGRKIALDPKLLKGHEDDEPLEDGKVQKCADNIARIWREETPNRGTQLVFCDSSTPASGKWNVYQDLKERLVRAGIPEEQIAFVHDAGDNPAKRERLFSKVRSGEIRVLMGSTQKLGTGTNVQERLAAIHDLDCPWRPADLEQRLGRILRQGNMYKKVKDFRYVTEGTFDAYSYQTVERKQRFISQLMSNKSPAREAADLDADVVTLANIKALATGDPDIQRRMTLENELNRLKLLRSAWTQARDDAKRDIAEQLQPWVDNLRRLIQEKKDDAPMAERAALIHRKAKEEGAWEGMTIQGRDVSDRQTACRLLADAANAANDGETIGRYDGLDVIAHHEERTGRRTLAVKAAHEHSSGTQMPGGLVTGAGSVVSQLDRIIRSMATDDGNLAGRLEHAEHELASAKEAALAPFDHEDEYRRTAAELARLASEPEGRKMEQNRNKGWTPMTFDAAGPAPAETDGTTKRERRERPDDGRASAPRRHGPRL